MRLQSKSAPWESRAGYIAGASKSIKMNAYLIAPMVRQFSPFFPSRNLTYLHPRMQNSAYYEHRAGKKDVGEN